MERIEHHASFEGWQDVFQHESTVLGCMMRFGIYLPPQAEHEKLPVLYWLSGLTCTEQNFITKAAVQRYAAEHGIIVVAPDTSPRGESVADDAAYDLGQGAGFYVDATELPWSDHYQMYSYVVDELPALIEANFLRRQDAASVGTPWAVMALWLLRFATPVAMQVSRRSRRSWRLRKFHGAEGSGGLLGRKNLEAWKQYDTVELIRVAQERLPLLVDQGLSDEFLEHQLRPQLLRTACEQVDHPLTLNLRPGHDHSYYFISTYLSEHMAHHAAALNR